MKILAFAASNSRQSINKKLAGYAASLVPNASVELLDLNDYELPLFSTDKEQELGHPALAQAFFNKITAADKLIISFAEHNGSYTAAYKNLFDWVSRINNKVYQHKPTLLLSTSPGLGGAASVMRSALHSAPFFGADVKANLSIPRFFDNFDTTHHKMINEELNQKLIEAIAKLNDET
ncbi:NADPH-dependent FMN reductase [Shewanella surugensis]|uniref:NAD(P)H-dependent oxidoreductase n=1 Tax=Shewanella surugensis TaxID=212020 RepID=A0ABT0LJL4_9GAMM|nr:NAD(P)H-dependent oxidoreductase [Shewanella surugensis]MCL1127555.1 NAD(P)H-dependent oxidoreductase [Shewanella surugensis]